MVKKWIFIGLHNVLLVPFWNGPMLQYTVGQNFSKSNKIISESGKETLELV